MKRSRFEYEKSTSFVKVSDPVTNRGSFHYSGIIAMHAMSQFKMRVLRIQNIEKSRWRSKNEHVMNQFIFGNLY